MEISSLSYKIMDCRARSTQRSFFNQWMGILKFIKLKLSVILFDFSSVRSVPGWLVGFELLSFN
jgi:hypothetical protein